MTPTADQVAHAVVAASRFYKVDPIKVIRQVKTAGSTERSRAMIYAGLAIADVFGNDQQASRLLGLTSARVSTTRWQLGKGALKWFDPKALELVKSAIPGVEAPASPPMRRQPGEVTTLPAVRETAPLARAAKPIGRPARRDASNFGTVAGMGPPRSPSRNPIGEKSALRNMLAEAVRNTAKLPSQN